MIPAARFRASLRNPFARLGLLMFDIAMPQYAMAQPGSILAAWRNDRSDSK